jgi:hypothetical protein
MVIWSLRMRGLAVAAGRKTSCPGRWWYGNLQRSGPMLIG